MRPRRAAFVVACFALGLTAGFGAVVLGGGAAGAEETTTTTEAPTTTTSTTTTEAPTTTTSTTTTTTVAPEPEKWTDTAAADWLPWAFVGAQFVVFSLGYMVGSR